MPALTYSQIESALGSYKDPEVEFKSVVNQVIPRLYSMGIYRDLTIQYQLPVIDGCITLPRDAESVLMFQKDLAPNRVRSMWHDFKAAGMTGLDDPSIWGLIDAGYHATSRLLSAATDTLYPVASVYDTNKAALNHAHIAIDIVGTDGTELYKAVFEEPAVGAFASAVLNPSGSNNDIEVTAKVSGVAANSLTVALGVNSSSNRTQLSVAQFGNAIQVTSGDKYVMRVTGSLTNGTSPVTFPDLPAVTTVNGRPYYYKLGAEEHEIVWTGTEWHLIDFTAGAEWRSSQNVAFPDLVTSWTPVSPATGTPTVAPHTATAAQVIQLINNEDSLPITASNHSPSDGTGFINTVAPTSLTGGAKGVLFNQYFFSTPVTLINSIKFTQTSGVRIVDLRTDPDDPDTTVATLGPENMVSRYRRYRIPSSNADTKAHVLVKRAYEPIVNNNDIVYVSNLAAIKHGLLAVLAEDNADLEKANYHWAEAQKNMEMEMESARGAATPSIQFDFSGTEGRNPFQQLM